jgi:hypothetical protein
MKVTSNKKKEQKVTKNEKKVKKRGLALQWVFGGQRA